VPRTIRGGGICEANDGGDALQISECPEIWNVRIPSASFAASSPCAQGEPWALPRQCCTERKVLNVTA